MNIYKVRKIIELIRRQGKLPKDAYGQMLSIDELIGWFSLNECLTVGEKSYVGRELAAMIEAELTMDKLKESEQIRSDMD
jgi:hypothetical protein